MQSNTPHLTLNDFSDLISYSLRDLIRKEGGLKNHHQVIDAAKDLSSDIFGRIVGELDSFTCATDLIDRIKTKAFTESRLRRCLLQCCLHLEKTDTSLPYLHLLGLNSKAGHLLREIRGAGIDEPGIYSDDSKLQIVTRLAADLPRLSENARKLYEEDLFAADIYRNVFQRKYRVTIPNEYQQAPVVVDRDNSALF